MLTALGSYQRVYQFPLSPHPNKFPSWVVNAVLAKQSWTGISGKHCTGRMTRGSQHDTGRVTMTSKHSTDKTTKGVEDCTGRPTMGQ